MKNEQVKVDVGVVRNAINLLDNYIDEIPEESQGTLYSTIEFLEQALKNNNN